ncbi:MAG: hypothetical protein IM516_00275, partial [Pseudanabaena sp. M158S2SP1A06QC]|nr:hypothetical protein [Pseudanabaena sp. M158S2SP1A06QC]
LKSNSDRTLTTHRPDRLSSQIKQRSPLITQNPIAYYPHQIAIARQQKQTRLPNSPKLNSDRPIITHKTRSPISQNQTAIAPHYQ